MQAGAMIGRIVITSVPKGLGGGSGFQPVLRTAGLPPLIAERLAMRAAYPHPYDFGNPANPRVLFHRIESVGDRTVHVLGSVRDAGSSYTGRSNHLAELLAIDPSETRSLPAGPAFAAHAFPWLGNWAGEPSEIPLGEEPAIPANDREDPEVTGRPRACTTWTSLAGDAGWAGELARSFLEGRSAVIWVEPGDDVAALFAEATLLLPITSRWNLTFNTCEIEPFPAHWRAWRSDLPVVGARQAKNDLVLDLATLRKTRERAPDHDLARRARGEAPSSTATPGRGSNGMQSRRIGADDDALRAHLKQISEERKRRSMTRPLQTTGIPQWSVWSILVTAAMGIAMLFALFVIVIAVSIGLDPGAASRWRAGRSSDVGTVPHAQELRSTSEQADQDARSKEDEKKRVDAMNDAVERANAQKVADREKKDKEARDKAEQQKQDEKREQDRKAAAEMQVRDKRQSQKTAVGCLAADGGRYIVSLRAKTPAFDLAVETEALPTPVDLCVFKNCQFEDLIDPMIEVACPYDGSERLTVEQETASLAGARTWMIVGSFFDRTAGISAKPVALCRVHGQKDRLWLEPLVATNHRLFGRLENSVLLVASKDPDTGAENVRRQIGLAPPINMTNRQILLNPLGGEPAGAPVAVELDQDLARRVTDVDPKRARWKIVLHHDALPHDVSLDDTRFEETLELAGPNTTGHDPKGITVVLSVPEKKRGYLDKTINVWMDACVTFGPLELRFDVRPKIRFLSEDVAEEEAAKDPGHILLKKILTPEQLAGISKGDDLRTLKARFERLSCDQKDPSIEEFQQSNRLLAARGLALAPPGSAANAGYTQQNMAAYNKELETIRSAVASNAKAIEDRREENAVRAKENCKATFSTKPPSHEKTLSSYDKWKKWFGAITAHITQLDLIARDSRGNEYLIAVVAEGGD